ncbi:MAG: hypothetical protein ACREBU_01560 [Nitrososphaera sp.]
MSTITGEVEAKRKDGRGIKVGDGWYGVFSAEALSEVNKGDSVEFEYVLNPRGFNDIKGGVKKTTGASSGNSVGSSRLADYERQMMIIRQNALTNAVNYYSTMEPRPGATDIVSMAQKFELYTSGKLGDLGGGE